MNRVQVRTPACAGTLLLLVLCGAACRQPAAVPAYEGDAAAQARVQSVMALGAQQRCAPEAVAQLQAIVQAYPAAAAPYAALRQTLESCQLWEPLAALLGSKPPAERSQDETVDLARLYIVFLQRFAEGEALIKPLVDAEPNNVDYVSLLTAALHYQQRGAEAVLYVDRLWEAIVAARNVDVMVMRALAYHDAGQSERALRILEQARAFRPDDTFLLTAFSQVAAALGHEGAAATADAASQAAREAKDVQIAMNTRLNDIYRRMGEAFNQGLFLDIEPLAQQLLEGGAPPALLPEIHRVRSRAFLELGRLEESAAAAEEAARIEQALSAGTVTP